jgi:hypothetical protein
MEVGLRGAGDDVPVPVDVDRWGNALLSLGGAVEATVRPAGG